MAVNEKAPWPTTTLTVNNWIPASHPECTSTNANALHCLLNSFGDRAHPGSTRGNRRHPAKRLKSFGKRARVTINVFVELRKKHMAFEL
jgi:hypothetical protein